MITTINLEAMSARVICLKVAGDSAQNKKTLCNLELAMACVRPKIVLEIMSSPIRPYDAIKVKISVVFFEKTKTNNKSIKTG
ncbi:hypothetical protein ID0576_12140 [Helicobacter pylori]